jgi:hypothetical protein
MSLHVVSRLLGQAVAEKTARQMEYPLGGRRAMRLGRCPVVIFLSRLACRLI